MAAMPPDDGGWPRTVPGLRDEIAELEHEQWIEWSQHLAACEPLSPERLARWRASWIPYDELSEEAKEMDRAYGDRILALLERRGIVRAPDDIASPDTTRHADRGRP